jgi:hypothetical protein
VQFKVPRCQNKIRARDGSLVRCPQQAHWVLTVPDGSSHHLICKPCSVRCSGVELVPIEYVVRQFASISREPAWPAQLGWGYRPEPRQEPPPRVCIVCGEEVAGAPYWCAGCAYWIARQSAFGKRVVRAIAPRLNGSTTLVRLRAEPGLLRDVRNVGPKSAQWLLEVELPVREPV